MTIQIGILTISDRSSRGERPDLSGPKLVEAVEAQGWLVGRTGIVPDDLDILIESLVQWVDEAKLNVILTTGGTGFSPRDVTPEATLAVIDRQAPGLTEAMRAASLAKTAHAMLSRAVAGIRGRTLIVNLPGSPKAAIENLAVITPVISHAVQLLTEDPGVEGSH